MSVATSEEAGTPSPSASPASPAEDNAVEQTLPKKLQQPQSQSQPQQQQQRSSQPSGVEQRGAPVQKLHAKAIYDNVADTSDELSFKKGDILTVLEQDTDGCVGWWLCMLRGRQGLCPGNRLRILNSYDSGCFSLSPASSPCPSLAASTGTLNSSICSADIYENSSIIGSAIGGTSVAPASVGHQQLQLQLQLQQQQQQQQPQEQPRHGTRRSWHVSPNKVITPQRHGDVYIYNYPAPLQGPVHSHLQQQQRLHQQQQQQQIYSNQSIYQNLPIMSNEFETYDTPKPATPVNYDCPKSICRTPTSMGSTQLRFDAMSLSSTSKGCSTPIQEESYDVPRPLTAALMHHQSSNMTPSSSNSSLLTSDSLSLSFSSSNRSSLANMPDYDIPRRNPLPVRAVHQKMASHRSQPHSPAQQQQHFANVNINTNGNSNGNGNVNCMTYDFPLPSTQSTPVHEKPSSHVLDSIMTAKELPLELSSALETLAKLQSAATAAITRLLSFVSPNWRVPDKLEPVVMEVKLAAVRLRTALHDLTEFGEGALGNATRSEDRNLAMKLRPLVRALRDADKLIHESSEALDAQGGWTLENLARSDDKHSCKPPDSLDQLIACAQTLTEDVRQTTSFIQGNASLLFKRNPPVIFADANTIDDTCTAANVGANAIDVGAGGAGSAEWLEDYDYVSFESKDAAARKNLALREAIPPNLKKKFDNVLKAAETTAMEATNLTITDKQSELTNNDKKLLRYYAAQITTHMGNLGQAIDSFLETVEKNQPPKFFIAYGKFVVVSAHTLVTIGDIVHRNVSKVELREKILRCTNALSDALKICVSKSIQAASQFPSVSAVQDMVYSVSDISYLASDLKTSMLHAVEMTT